LLQEQINRILKKRKIEVAVISDVHLGTYGCHAEELLAYLSSIKPSTLVLNGDIMDVWQFNKRYFPASHLKVVKKIINLATNGTRVVYITGNHDEIIRKFTGTSIGDFSIRNKLVLELDGKKAWFFHGDVFDVSLRYSRWLAKLGNYGYAALMLLNRLFNWILKKTGREKYSLSKNIKNSLRRGTKYCNDFERTASELAIEGGYDYVICGHIHQPKKQPFENRNGRCTYLNAGDWLEHLTALEYSFKRWKVYNYSHDKLSPFFADEELKEMDINELISNIIDLRLKKDRSKEIDGESVGD
jgi:UDP-2,3-diacylglucosamine pyrophosphatase LpxH